MTSSALSDVRVVGPRTQASERVLTREALDFIGQLHAQFADRRRELLSRRRDRSAALQAGGTLSFLEAGPAQGEWRVASAPADLDDRRVEITGPAEPKMMINALNSGASVFMADLEDALSPTWSNVVDGQGALMDGVRRTLSFTSPEGKQYKLNDRLATLVVRPRGWHLEEAHVQIAGRPASASLFDFGLFFFHNAREALARGSGPYFYLPKMESHLEARLWNEVFIFAQETLGVPRGSVRATMLIETIYAAFEMEEMLYELREHAAGLNAGRWDYLFSIIKNFRHRPEFVLPDRAQLTMTVPFMRAYTELLVQTCHRRNAHAIGGMAAFIPSRKDAEVNATAFARVREDKGREARDGYDGAWVAHPDLVPLVAEVFGEVLGDRPNQKERQRDDVRVTAKELLDVRVSGGKVSEAGVRGDASVALQYLAAWLGGSGAVGINNLMEDAATAEIARSQLWQWIRHRVRTDEGSEVTLGRVRSVLAEETARLRPTQADPARLEAAAALLDQLVSAEEFPEFLTLQAYQRLD